MNIVAVYWWVIIPILGILFYKTILRIIFGMVIIPEDRIGLVIKKFVLFGPDKELPDGRIIATKGEAGYQAKALAPGLYWFMFPWQYGIQLEAFTVIPEGKLGLVLSKDGAEIPTGNILGRKVDCDNFQDSEKFLINGGQKGRQTAIITAGTYRINTQAFSVTIADMTVIRENMVGIITMMDGMPITQGQIAGKHVEGHNNFQDIDAFLINGGNKGLQPQIILAGSYNVNRWAVQIEEIR